MNISVNGKIVSADVPSLMVSNRSYRYGDGLFETMKVINGKIILPSLHFERLFASLLLLKFNIPEILSVEKLQKEILYLCKKNGCELLARIRLSIFRGNGGLYDGNKELQYIIECSPVSESVNKLNEEGFVIDVYNATRKTCDIFSNLKSANFLPYTMAALHALENKLDDCLVLNTAGNIADATIANIFIIKKETIITPSLAEGCISGVMRKYLLAQLKNLSYNVKEDKVSVPDIKNADEIFLTNAINGIRWVKQFRDKVYSNSKTTEIYNSLIQKLYKEIN